MGSSDSNLATASLQAASVGHWIGGREVAGAGRTADVFDPATGAAARKVQLADAAEVDAAVRRDQRE